MKIAIVGGHDRASRMLEPVARACGHELECHAGEMNGRGGESLAAIVERSDVIVVFTDVNSHAAVWGARRLARNRGRRCVLVRRLGSARFRALLGELDEPHCSHALCA